MAPISYSRVKPPIFFSGHGSLKSIFFLVEREEGERDEGELILSCLVPLSAAKVEVEEKSRLFPLSSVFAFPSSSAEEEEDEEGLLLVGVFFCFCSLFPLVPTGCLFLFWIQNNLSCSKSSWVVFAKVENESFGSKTPSRSAPSNEVAIWEEKPSVFEKVEEDEEGLFLVGVFMLPFSPKISFLFSIALELFFLVGREEVSSLFPLVQTGCLFLFWIQKNLSCSKSSGFFGFLERGELGRLIFFPTFGFGFFGCPIPLEPKGPLRESSVLKIGMW